MQTFLPYADFDESACVLDRQRLGKQRVEVKQILTAYKSGWANHPATRMWAGYSGALALYGIAICKEWIARGYKDSLLAFFEGYHAAVVASVGLRSARVRPPWLNNAAFHASHRSNLLRKAPEHYRQFGWDEPDDLPYVWPTQNASPSCTSLLPVEGQK